MKEYHLFFAPNILSTLELPQEEACHAIRVLRMSIGDTINITDGNGNLYLGKITEASTKHCKIKILECIPQQKTWTNNIHIAVSPTKSMERMEWFAEKATEIGFDQLSLLLCQRTERKIVKKDRIDKILISAMKQSHKYTKPLLSDSILFSKFITQPFQGQKFIAHCYDDADIGEKSIPLYSNINPNEDTLVLIGPEGDFSIEEVKLAIKNNFIPITLGKSRLRTETAALVAVHMMLLSKQN